MGLDIRGYYGVKLVGIREATDEEYEEPLIVVTEYFGAFPDAVKRPCVQYVHHLIRGGCSGWLGPALRYSR